MFEEEKSRGFGIRREFEREMYQMEGNLDEYLRSYCWGKMKQLVK